MAPEEIVGTSFRVYRTAPGFVRCDHPAGAEVTGQDARHILDAFTALTDDHTTPVLVDIREARSVSREARKAFSQSAASRIALYVDSSLSRTIANFFIGVARPDVPTKVFTDLDEAQRWLLDEE